MGYKEATHSEGLRLTVKHGTICEESKTPRDGFEPVQTFNPTTKESLTRFIKAYSEIEAFVEKIEYRDTEQTYDQRYVSWVLHLVDEHGEPATLNISLNSKVASRLMKTSENIDFSKMVIFRAFPDRQTEPPSTAFVIGQGRGPDGKILSVKQKYTREDMGDCPDAVQTRKGWSYDSQEDFLISRMLDVVAPAVEAAAKKRANAAPQSRQEETRPTARPEPETPAEQPQGKEATPSGGRRPAKQEKINMLLAIARGCDQTNGTLDSTIKGFFPGESLTTIIDEEAEVIIGYFREMMQKKG